MKTLFDLIYVSIIIILFIAFRNYSTEKLQAQQVEEKFTLKMSKTAPPCTQMFFYIEKYAEIYNIPKRYAYGIAFQETRFYSPLQWNYDHKKVSSAGALGPMQVMYSTAQMMWPNKHISKDELKNDIEFNVKTSMKLLHHLKKTYKDWKIVFGYYNTGRPIINQYAIDVYNYQQKI